MSSSKAEGGGALGFVADGTLGFDPDEILIREPGLLLDPRFLGALQEELELEMGAEEARITLLQMGALHGLLDATRVVEAGLAAPSAQAVSPGSSALPLRLRPHPVDADGLLVEGSWPERAEAGARLSRSGVADAPSCWLSAGYTSGWLSGILGADVVAVETHCAARGDEACCFVAREPAAWLDEADPGAELTLGALPFAALRELVDRELAASPGAAARPGPLSSDEPVVHIWGPVMVIPYGGVDEAMAAVELIARDPGASQVSVVVMDLSGAIIDEAFGAAALERIIECVEAWGAETILAGASSLSEAVIEGLERPPLLVHKDLHEAIAAAFRIAEAQRQAL